MKMLLSILLLLTVIFGCQKNHPPTCEIISPVPGSEFMQGEIITISVDAYDSDGSIKEVRFYIDGIGITSVPTFPYNYEWNIASVDIGTHTLRAVAIDDENLEGEASLEVTITESSHITDSRDGNEYESIAIGTQVWMAENLAYLPSVSPPETGSDSQKQYYVYGYSGTNISAAKTNPNFSIYGVLYNWSAAIDGEESSFSNPSGVKGICPDGWHLPSDEEWLILEKYLGMNEAEANSVKWRNSGIVGGALKEAGTSHWESPNTEGTNTSGFSALGGGERNPSGIFRYLNNFTGFWSASDYDASFGFYRFLGYDRIGVDRNYTSKSYGFYVRCIKDE
jgi:uncharacterized protein (TIGR02145 family)